MKFRLLVGSHKEGNRKLSKGDEIDSDRRLDKIFAGKFECITADPVPVDAVLKFKKIESFAIRKVRGVRNQYRVVSKVNGKPIHDGILTRSEAHALAGKPLKKKKGK